jgi:alpha-tubulin suppressor-like RCC1 family protein
MNRMMHAHRSAVGGSMFFVAMPSCASSSSSSAEPLPEVSTSADAVTASADFALGDTHACLILRPSGQVKCWGSNFYGELGLGDTNTRGDNPGELGGAFLPALPLGLPSPPLKIASGGGSHTCVIAADGRVKCWGLNSFGQLGLGDTNNRGDVAGEIASLPYLNLGTGRTAKALAMGQSHTCAILDNNTVKCWGAALFGQLGSGNTTSRGDNAGEMGDTLPTVSLGTGRTAKAIAAGLNHTCVILDNDAVKCWGDNFKGQLGLNSTATIGDGPGEMGDSLPAVNLGSGGTIGGLFLGLGHSCAWFNQSAPASDRILCWGLNNYGQLGHGDTIARGDNAGEMASLPLTLVHSGTPNRTDVIAAGAGRYHNCVVLLNPGGDGGAGRRLKCWGLNQNGQLGLGDVNNRGDVAGEMGGSLPVVNVSPLTTDVRGSSDSTCVLSNQDTGSGIQCFGYGGTGLPGQGNVNSIGDQPSEMPPAPVPIF